MTIQTSLRTSCLKTCLAAAAIAWWVPSSAWCQLLTIDAAGNAAGGQVEQTLAVLQAGKALDAYRRLQAIAGEDVRVPVDGGAVGLDIAVARWQEPFRRELERAEGDAAATALAALLKQSSSDPANTGKAERLSVALVELTHRVFSPAVRGQALAEAGRRLAIQGDLVSARQLLARAESFGFRVDRAAEDPGGVIAAIRMPATAPRAAAEILAAYAWWNNTPDRLEGVRGFPLLVPKEGVLVPQETAIFTSPTHVAALRDGKPAWAWPPLPTLATPPVSRRPAGAKRPALRRTEYPLYGAANSFGIVVARTGSIGGKVRGELHAFRASDGKPLWTFDALHCASLPAIAGRYVYVLAADSSAAPTASPALYLLALDLMTGETLFKSTLGQLSAVTPLERDAAPELWDDAGPPAIAGDKIYVATSGAITAFDRFDGSFRRSATYLPDATTARPGNRPSEVPMSRWAATPLVTDKLVVVATRDADAVTAYDRDTLAKVWTVANLGNYTLFAVTPKHALLQGPEIIALDLTTGGRGFTSAPRTGTVFTGPALLTGDAIVVPASKGPMALSSRAGAWLDQVPAANLRILRPWLSGDAVDLLRAADALTPFADP